MRRIAMILGLSAIVGAVSGSSAMAQNPIGGTDPFAFYYGVYLPRAAALASQPRVNDVIRDYSIQRQFTAVTERAGLYDPAGPIGMDEYDPLRPFANRGRERRTRVTNTGVAAMNLNGQGPAGFFNRSQGYHPTMKTGRYQNRNLYTPGRAGGQSQGMGGMGGTGGGYR